MQIRILGASGGIGNGAQTTALLVDHDVLIDAGTGVTALSLDELVAIDHVVLTHAHLDHVACIPFLVDSVGSRRRRPLTVHAQEPTLTVLRQHLFNDALWPDFTRIPSAQQPFLQYAVFEPGTTLTLGQRTFRSIPVTHSVPAVGILAGNGRASLAFSGDITTTDLFWKELNACPDLSRVIIETSFTDEDESLARLSGHLSPRLLADELRKLARPVPISITHLMPGEDHEIMDQIHHHLPDLTIEPLRAGMVFEL